jgi:L-iditol 2-dehydrogenase
MMPRTMRAAVLYDVDDLRIEERAVPQLGDGELLVRTMASGICSGDVVAWYIRRKAPLVLGHEPAGIVTAIRGETAHDRDGNAFSIGDRVFVHHHAPCFACDACRRGDHVQCATWRQSKIDPGGIAEFFRVPRENQSDTLHLPGSVSFTDAALVEPLACVVKSLRRGGVGAGATLYVIGLGVMGQLHVLAGDALGARVFAVDFIAARRELAQRNGAIAFAPAETQERLPGGAGVVICGPGTPQAMRTAVRAAAPGGSIVMFTPFEPGAALELDAERFYFGDLRLVGSYSCGPDDTVAALRLIERGIVTAEKVGATFITLDEVPQAYRDLAESRIVKPIVRFD